MTTKTTKQFKLNTDLQNEISIQSNQLKKNASSNKNLNQAWMSTTSLNYLPNNNSQIRHEHTNQAFTTSSRSIHPIESLNKISATSLQKHAVAPQAIIESSHHTYPNIVPPKIKPRKKDPKPGLLKSKLLNSPRRRLCFKIILVILIFLLMASIGFTIFASIKPCTLAKCNEKASLCINRFPFWAQCICDDGYAGNGKSFCNECGKTFVSTNLMRIIGGAESIKSSWPFAVYIIQNYKGRYNIKGSSYMISYSWSCGGTILNHKTILTAAHCIHDQNFEYQDPDDNYYTLQIQWNEWYSNLESTFEVYVGVHDIRYLNNSRRVRVKKVTKHEDFDEFNLKNDIATIQLEDMIYSTQETQYACLPYTASNDYPKESSEAFIIGWGRISEKGASSNVLKNSKIEVYNQDKCSKVETKILKDWDSQICAGVMDGSTDTCQGDSGGGLFSRKDTFTETRNLSQYYVSGVVSYGDGCARVGKPGIYSRTSYFLEWIRKNSDF